MSINQDDYELGYQEGYSKGYSDGSTVTEDSILKFYYCESQDKYYVGKRLDTMYYAEVIVYTNGHVCLSYEMSRFLPWGQHIVDENTLWKEHTYPSEPKEIPFETWLEVFIKRQLKKRRCQLIYNC